MVCRSAHDAVHALRTNSTARRENMELAMIGLGRMGANMTERLVRAGHRVVGYARSAESRQRAVQGGGEAATSLAGGMEKLRPPRVIWLMIPAGPTLDQTLEGLGPLLG